MRDSSSLAFGRRYTETCSHESTAAPCVNQRTGTAPGQLQAEPGRGKTTSIPDAVGVGVGGIDGIGVGPGVGCDDVGASDGPLDGTGVGSVECDGLGLGSALGTGVGLELGADVGAANGAGDGIADGGRDGTGDGSGVGAGLGSGVGSPRRWKGWE